MGQLNFSISFYQRNSKRLKRFMNTFYARHTWRMDVDKATRESIFAEGRIAAARKEFAAASLPVFTNRMEV